MKSLLKNIKSLNITKDDKVGLYLTIIVHLVVVIILLTYRIHTQISRESSLVLDFTGYDERVEKERREEMKASVSEELDAMIAAARKGENIRNIAVDASAKRLKDDRFDNPEEIYEDAKRLQEKLNRSKAQMDEASDPDDGISLKKEGENSSGEAYKGASVISYSLDGRKARYLPVPAYKCQQGGDVSVMIIVNSKGYVISAKVIESVSSPDECLRKCAVDAAARSRFSASADSRDKETGEIVYRFISQ